MRLFDLGLALTVTLSTAQCARETDAHNDPSGAPAPDTTIAQGAQQIGEPAKATPPRSDAPPAVKVPIAGLPILGDAKAPVTIVAFLDYDCPYCAKADQMIGKLRRKYGTSVRVALAMRPLPMHDRATYAARALLAAEEQNRAEAMHEALFASMGQHDDDGLIAAARSAGLDLRRFEIARTGPSTEKALERASQLAQTLDARGTPTFYINGRKIVGAQPEPTFRALIDEELAKAEQMMVAGIPAKSVYDAIMAEAAPPPPPEPEKPPFDVKAVAVPIDGAPFRGAARAPITIVMFSDFECPYCVKSEKILAAVEAAYPGKTRVVWKQRPLPMHEHARLAAKASLAADAQGKFWEYHDVLVAHRDALDRVSLERYAAEVRLDPARFTKDLDDPRLDKKIEADEALASELGVSGTPTFYVNGHRIEGAQPLATFKAAIDHSLTVK